MSVEDDMLTGEQIAMSDADQRFVYETNHGELINLLSREISEDNMKKGFYEDDKIVPKVLVNLPFDELSLSLSEVWATNRKLARLALIHTEISEAAEGIRKDAFDDKLPNRKQEEVELADALIRILDYAGAYGLDLGGAMVEKLNYNRGRAYKHGKKV